MQKKIPEAGPHNTLALRTCPPGLVHLSADVADANAGTEPQDFSRWESQTTHRQAPLAPGAGSPHRPSRPNARWATRLERRPSGTAGTCRYDARGCP